MKRAFELINAINETLNRRLMQTKGKKVRRKADKGKK
jgi:hypothetical protein